MMYTRSSTRADLEPYQRTFLLYAGIIVIMLAVLLIFYEYIQLATQQMYYFKNWENVIQMFVFVGAITFVSNFVNACMCNSSAIWQLGAFVVASAWFNLLILLRNVAAPINLFILIIGNFVKLVYLPMLLVTTFGVPFYMLFVRDEDGIVSKLPLHT